MPNLSGSRSSGLIHWAVPPSTCVTEVVFALSETIVSRPKSARRARPSRSIRMLALSRVSGRTEVPRRDLMAYPFEIPVNHLLAMQVVQPPSNIFQLRKSGGC